MGDGDIFDTEEEVGEGQQQQAGKKRIGFLPAIVIDILKWSAIVIGAIIFVVVVVVITVNTLDRGTRATVTRVPLSSEMAAEQAPELEWFRTIDEIRGTTQDERRFTFIVEPAIGYAVDDEAAAQELLRREVQLREVIDVYFSSRSHAELEGVENRERVKAELLTEINRIMIDDVREVVFERYEFIEF